MTQAQPEPRTAASQLSSNLYAANFMPDCQGTCARLQGQGSRPLSWCMNNADFGAFVLAAQPSWMASKAPTSVMHGHLHGSPAVLLQIPHEQQQHVQYTRDMDCPVFTWICMQGPG